MRTDMAAIVTGGGTGIGRAVSLRLASQGVAVAVIYSRSADDAAATVRDIQAMGGRGVALRCDVSRDDQARAAAAAVREHFGGVDYLVNNAGITRQLPFADLDAIEDAAWDDLYAVNVKGAFHMTRAVAPLMTGRSAPAVVNIGSIAGETGYGSSLPYAVSKAALHGLTRSLARALAPHIRVNALAPGMVDTRWWDGNHDKMHMLAGQVALGRVATPDDIADMVLALLTARTMTGQVVRTDCGQTL